MPVIYFIFCKAFISAKKSFVLKIRNSLSTSEIYSKPQSLVQSKICHIHSSPSSIDRSLAALIPANAYLGYQQLKRLFYPLAGYGIICSDYIIEDICLSENLPRFLS